MLQPLGALWSGRKETHGDAVPAPPAALLPAPPGHLLQGVVVARRAALWLLPTSLPARIGLSGVGITVLVFVPGGATDRKRVEREGREERTVDKHMLLVDILIYTYI